MPHPFISMCFLKAITGKEFDNFMFKVIFFLSQAPHCHQVFFPRDFVTGTWYLILTACFTSTSGTPCSEISRS